MGKVAVFIDHSNIFNSCVNAQEKYDFELISRFVQTLGIPVVGKVYLNANIKGGDAGLVDRLFYKYFENGYEPVYAPEYIYLEHSKSLSGSMMARDIIQTVYEKPYVDTFVIVSGDKDFLPVVRKLVELNKSVVVLGVEASTAQPLIHECERLQQQFVDYLSLKEAFENDEEW